MRELSVVVHSAASAEVSPLCGGGAVAVAAAAGLVVGTGVEGTADAFAGAPTSIDPRVACRSTQVRARRR